MTDPFTPLAAAPKAIITAIEITRHRLHFDPPFRASWDTKPRTFWDAAIVRVHTDLGVTGIGSGDMMLGFEGHEHLFVGQDALAIERHWRISRQHQLPLGPLLAARSGAVGSGRQDRRPAVLEADRRPVQQRARLCFVGHAARPRRARRGGGSATSRKGFTALKIRFHRGDWRADIRALEAVRARVGDRLELMVDCNQGWRMSWDAYAPWTLKDALRSRANSSGSASTGWRSRCTAAIAPACARLRERDRRAHRRRRNDPRALRVSRPHRRGLPRRAAAGRGAGRRASPACAASR